MNDEQPLVELIYFSCSIKSLTKEDFELILQDAQRKNKTQNISGAIYYCNGFFLQLIEGPRQNINRLFQSICHDARHYDISLISFRNIQQKRFDQWSMEYLDQDISELLKQQSIQQLDLDTSLKLFNGEAA